MTKEMLIDKILKGASFQDLNVDEIEAFEKFADDVAVCESLNHYIIDFMKKCFLKMKLFTKLILTIIVLDFMIVVENWIVLKKFFTREENQKLILAQR